jgi:hypothetical protein
VPIDFIHDCSLVLYKQLIQTSFGCYPSDFTLSLAFLSSSPQPMGGILVFRVLVQVWVYPANPVDVPLVCEGGGAEEVHGVVLSCEKDTISPWLQGNPVNCVTSPSTSALLSCCTMAPIIGEASISGRQSTRVRRPNRRYSSGREEERGREGREPGHSIPVKTYGWYPWHKGLVTL